MANVAVGTVSRYLNGQEIRQGNRARIEKAIESTSFRRSAAAATIRKEYSNFVGFLVPRYDEFHARLLEHVVHGLQPLGRVVIPFSHTDHELTLSKALDFFSEHRVDAMIMSGDVDYHDQTRQIADSAIPVVIYNNDIRGLYVDRVLVDNVAAAYTAIELLINFGHRRIAFLAGRKGDSSAAERETGYRKALADAGIEFDENCLVHGDWTFHGGYFGAQALVDQENVPTAMLSANYLMTYGALDWLKRAQVKIPAELSVVSFDDCDLFRLLDNGITAVSQPVSEIARSIVELVRSRLSDPDAPDTRSITLNCDLIQRGSTSKPNTD